jgi:hypothetical protein
VKLTFKLNGRPEGVGHPFLFPLQQMSEPHLWDDQRNLLFTGTHHFYESINNS